MFATYDNPCDFFENNAYIESKSMKDRRIKMTISQKRALRRSRSNRIFAGVCGGLAEFYGISSFWFRLAMFIAFIPGGVPGLLIYAILWMIIPSE